MSSWVVKVVSLFFHDQFVRILLYVVSSKVVFVKLAICYQCVDAGRKIETTIYSSLSYVNVRAFLPTLCYYFSVKQNFQFCIKSNRKDLLIVIVSVEQNV